MNEVVEKVLISVIGAIIGSVITYGTKGISLEGRLDGIERAVVRIEHTLSAKQ